MSRKTVVLLGTAGLLVVFAITLFFFARYQVRKSFPDVSGTITVAGPSERVTIDRDEYGVPFVNAANDHDAMFALGYVHAQDRLWQMDISRRAGEGRLSELFGGATLEFDRMFRIVGIRHIAEEIERSMSPESHRRLQWYAEGVNAFIRSHKGKYPIEFDLLRYDPEEWTPVNSIEIARLMAWELNLSWWTDLTYGAIAERVGLSKTLDIFPSFPDSVAPVIPPAAWKAYATVTRGFLATSQSYTAMMGGEAMAGGSNAWVVGPSHSATGSVILANDVHLRLQVPSKWYELHFRTPEVNVRGMSVPGVPGIVSGRNDSLAWGVTNVMADDADFYIERLDSATSTQYWYDGAWRPLIVHDEEIHVRGDSTVIVHVRATHHGPLVSDVRLPLQKYHTPYAASMRWTGSGTDDPIDAFAKMNRARNWKEFVAGVKEFAVPGQNFVYGDARGNIGYWCGAKIPIRGRQSTLLPLPGWDKSAEWHGFVPFEQMPHMFNPREGYIATANNKIVDDSYPYHISDLWEPPSRIVRLREILGKPGDLFSVEDCSHLQNDTYSHFAKELTPYILAACRDTVLGIPEEERVMSYLTNWDFRFARDDIATSIFQSFFVRFAQNTFEDEMGSDLFHDWVTIVNIPIRVTSKLVAEGTSQWFDDVNTPEIETRDMIIRKSMKQGIDDLRARFGSDMRKWRWGDMHTVTLPHPFGLVKPLDRLFNIGPFPYSGGSTSLISGEYSINEPYAVTVGASFRLIEDFSRSDDNRAVLPSGESGQLFHPHYGDQTDFWLNGGLRSVSMTGAGERFDRLTLVPEKRP